MDEQDALKFIHGKVPRSGDDAAFIQNLLITTDMLHKKSDFPQGMTYYTAGWRSVGASLSDIAAMGGDPIAVVAAYSSPEFRKEEIEEFIRGANEVCQMAGAEYVGGDLDSSDEFSVVTTAVGKSVKPVFRRGAEWGDVVCVTGDLGRSAAAKRLFERNENEKANEMFRFKPRIEEGLAISQYSTSMMDSSDGLVRSLYEMGKASMCGFEIDSNMIPINEMLKEIVENGEIALRVAMTYGEDFELVFTAPREKIKEIEGDIEISITIIGEVVERDIKMDGELIENQGYTHG